MKLAIIGTAGRKDDAPRITLPLWNDMKRIVARFVAEQGIRHVISGGAAVADHMAVGLYLAGLVGHLDLALPAAFDTATCRFHDTGGDDSWDNPGGVCNWYHEHFSKRVGIDSLAQIAAAIAKGATVTVEAGFDARNTLVARADMLIAFTFGDGAALKPGGTSKTLRKYLDNGGLRCYHCDLNDMTLHFPATLP